MLEVSGAEVNSISIAVHIDVHVCVYRYVHIHAQSAPHVHTRSKRTGHRLESEPRLLNSLSQ